MSLDGEADLLRDHRHELRPSLAELGLVGLGRGSGSSDLAAAGGRSPNCLLRLDCRRGRTATRTATMDSLADSSTTRQRPKTNDSTNMRNTGLSASTGEKLSLVAPTSACATTSTASGASSSAATGHSGL